MKYSEFKKMCGFENLNKNNLDEWALISHALHAIGHESFKYYEKFLSESENPVVKELYEAIKNEREKNEKRKDI
ncbi:MAG TPA: hypothetical protein PLT70_00510 [bacterium]|nr:hypothetical protein [bacterium]HQN73184.1 hypothetical protein [bacterium]